MTLLLRRVPVGYWMVNLSQTPSDPERSGNVAYDGIEPEVF